ncbi:glutamine--tRNA ligase/YqeY domain fusion protein [Maridesulfovibrio frigidus]|uniref:glutamine--tRNA ligase/YqeY domain fusion protein n=1 Tax=Maridesulfovibrio frigidus TaxID=340956 RepID=UPI0004E1A8C1|nr:glutamine--tRNA ligase/YqeY domain fusion protein [Maridesulfovibrio frigidus]
MSENTTDSNSPKNFIAAIIEKDNETGKYDGRVATRFPPEPNGYLHIGHAKSICLNFGLAKDFGGTCNLRFDDTNPAKEEVEYVESIQEDVRWLGFDWEDRLHYSSDYFDDLYALAVQLIKNGKAYVDSLSAEETREYRGTLTEPGKDSPYRSRSVEENLTIFEGMKNGEFADGEHLLRAKIDMASPNMIMRDPALYRIRKVDHHRTGDKWCIYPMYDFTHCLSDSLEKITHSVCTLEFENNRPLYDWVLENLGVYRPQQIEFARLNLTYTVMSKRRLIQLVEDNQVSGWDDPRMPTISGMRRRGYSPAAIRNFCERIGVAKATNMVDFALLEFSVREDLNETSSRYMGVVNPLKVVIENYPEDKVEEFEFLNNPGNPDAGSRMVPFSKVLYIEREDYMEDAPKKFFRLSVGREVRLRYGYYITCTEAIKDENGEVVELRCTYDPATIGGWSKDGRKVKGTIHWVSVAHAKEVEVRLYEHLFTKENPMDNKDGSDFKDHINPDSLKVLPKCYVEPFLGKVEPGFRCQFERVGYFCVDKDSTAEKPVFNRTATLRDTWKRITKNQK